MDRAVDAYGQSKHWIGQMARKAKRICYRTIWAECDWMIYTNVGVPESATIFPNDGPPPHGGDLNSIGLYQQRSPWWWTAGDRPSIVKAMDPYASTIAFLAAVERDSPNWFQLDESVVAQRTQQSQFDGRKIDPKTGKPYPYAQNYVDRGPETDALEGDPQYFANAR